MNNFNKSLNQLKNKLGFNKNIIKNTKKIKNNEMINNFMIITISTLAILFIVFLIYRYMDNELNNRYRSIQDYHQNKDNINKPCPKGCNRGLCTLEKTCYDPFPPNPKCCAFDNQCRYCTDKSGVIIEDDHETVRDEIRDKYYKNYANVQNLNEDIKEENSYIDELNRTIRKRNKDILF